MHEPVDPANADEGASPQPKPRRFELGTDGPRVIVAGVDGTETSLRAAAYAAGLARRQHARLLYVHVRTSSSGLLAAADPAGRSLATVTIGRAHLEAELRKLADEQAQAWGIDADVRVVDGDPFAQLKAIATAEAADAIVVGASQQFGHRMAGSIAVRLVRAGRWPVTVVP